MGGKVVLLSIIEDPSKHQVFFDIHLTNNAKTQRIFFANLSKQFFL